MVWGEWVEQKIGLHFVPANGEYLRLPNSEDWFEVRAVVRNVDGSAEVEADVYAIHVDKAMVLKGV